MYTHKCTHAHTRTHTRHTHVYMFTETHTQMHGGLHVHTHTHTHTHTPLPALTLSPCFHYVPINSQNNFFTNCVLSLLCSLWLPILIRIKDKALSPVVKVWCDLTFNSSALAVYPTLCSWSPATGVSLLFFPQAKLISIPEFFVSLKCSLLMAGSSLFVVTPSLRKAIPYIQLEVSLSHDTVLWWYSAHFCICLLKSVSSARLSVKRKAGTISA